MRVQEATKVHCNESVLSHQQFGLSCRLSVISGTHGARAVVIEARGPLREHPEGQAAQMPVGGRYGQSEIRPPSGRLGGWAANSRSPIRQH